MRTLFTTLLLLACLVGHAAVPTMESFETTQFDTNALSIKYRSDWTNEVGVLRPASVNTEITLTNLNLYETFITPAKVYALTLGTNELNVATNTSWLLSSPTNDAAQVILSLSAGKFQGQWLLITSQNDTGGFTLPDQSEQYDVPGALVDMQGDWVGTTNRGTILQYVAPDWIEMFRFNPEAPAPTGFTTGAGVTNISDVVSGNYTAGSNITLTTNANGAVAIAAAGGGGTSPFTNIAGVVQFTPDQTATNRLTVISGAADNATNVAQAVGSASTWSAIGALLGAYHNNQTNVFEVDRSGSLVVGRYSRELYVNNYNDIDQEALVSIRDSTKQDGDNYSMVGTYNGSVYSIIYGNTDALVSELNIQGSDGVHGHRLYSDAGGGGSIYTILVGSAEKVRLYPNIASSGSAVAHLLDTSNVLTNGDSILLIANNGVIHGRIAGNSGYSGAGTKFLTDDGTYQTGSSASIVTYTNQFVFNSKVTYNADVYVTNATIYINNVDVRSVSYGGACSDETTPLITGTAKLTFRLPHAMTLTAVRASLTTAQASGSIFTVDINENGTTVLSTKLTVDNTEKTSTTAAAPPVISDTALADDAEISIDIDQVGTSGATGLKIWLTGLRL